MVTCYPILRQRMIEFGTTYEELAAVANINIVSLHMKMLGMKRWKLTEALRICCFFRTHDVEHLFYKRWCSVCSDIL